MTAIACKLLVIGGGPGGYVCAIRAGQLGIDTVLVEAGKLGGTCLNVGCIPSKAIIHAADEFARLRAAAGGGSAFGLSCAAPALDWAKTVAWKDGIVRRLSGGVGALLRKARVKVVTGTARFRDGRTVLVATETGPREIRAEHVVIATGSVPVELSSLPFGGPVISSTEALSLTQVPRKLAVVGAGYIGLELGMAFAKLGSDVTIVESQAKALPLYDEELTAPVMARLKQLGILLLARTRALGLAADGALSVQQGDGPAQKIAADKILVTVGRKPQTQRLGLEELVVDMDGSAIRINERCETSMRGLFAIGDVTGEPMLAHRAMAQGEMVAEIVSGRKRAWDKRAIPAVCFTDPEIVSVGLSPDQARDAGLEVKVAQFPFAANGRAMTLEDESGFVRVVAHAATHEVRGIQAAGRGVSELAAAFGVAVEMGARLEDIGATIHAHPTLGEAFQEACLRALGHAVHI
jgi:dihydrolipoamide dehydrogenase